MNNEQTKQRPQYDKRFCERCDRYTNHELYQWRDEEKSICEICRKTTIIND